MPMQESFQNSAKFRWENKTVRESILIDDVADESRWAYEGRAGSMQFIPAGGIQGANAVRLTSPTKIPYAEGMTIGRPFGQVSLRCQIDDADWSRYNRLSFWVRPNVPGHRHISMLLRLYNDGSIKVPYYFNREGAHYFMLEEGKWNQVLFEIAHIPRDKITALAFTYRLQGNEPCASDAASFDISRIEIQDIEASDDYEGWNVAENRIAYCHTGYLTNAQKTALSSDLSLHEFKVIDADTNNTMLSKPTAQLDTPLGKYRVFDFSEITREGQYYIQSGNSRTQPFRIAGDVWNETIWKTVNFFYCQRCGTEVPGVHDLCHADALCRHEDKTIVANGGWHDAGDLSQSLGNTSDAVVAMLELADSVRLRDPELAQRLTEEARWGLQWILKTRFADGYRAEWITLDFWTDNIIGTFDDVKAKAIKPSFPQAQAALAEAAASIAWRESDPILADYSLKCAKEDLQFALAENDFGNLQTASMLGLSALKIYEATGEDEFANTARRMAQIVLQCQQTEPFADGIPFSGFFHTDPTHQHIRHYSHRSYDEFPIRLLAGLCKASPEDPMAGQWKQSVSMYAQYLKQICEHSAPYQMIPAGIYNVKDGSEEDYSSQVQSGILLGGDYYLRLFPVWVQHRRGNFGTILSQAKALSTAARLLDDPQLLHLSVAQLEWIVGKNPFCQSTMYGEGHDFPPMFSVCSGDIVGALPVGIMTHLDKDVPYWPQSVMMNYKEVWVFPSARWLSILADVYAR